jgi:hypothetical protein
LLNLDVLAKFGIYAVVYALAATVFLLLLRSGRWKSLRSVTLYLATLLVVDGVGRSLILHRYGFQSPEYAYFFWITDVILVLVAFALVCVFFRRAAQGEPQLWHHLRLLLTSVFVLVVAWSSASVFRNFDSLFTIFIVELQQNLYFACLVLNTLLYIYLQKAEHPDEELVLLVSGLGIQFAGPAAALALKFLTPGPNASDAVLAYVPPLCTLGMLFIWFFAMTRPPVTVPAEAQSGRAPVFAEATARGN